MKSNDRNIVRTAGTRCSLCSRPDRDDLDRDLVLQKKTQTEVAQLVGVDRSSVSRHVKNHLQPQIASEILLGEEFSVMNVVEELDRIYGRRQLAIERAGMAGDARLERDLLNSQQRLLFDVVKAVTQLGEGGLRYLEGLQNRKHAGSGGRVPRGNPGPIGGYPEKEQETG